MTGTEREPIGGPPQSRSGLSDDLGSIERRRPFRWGLLIGALVSVSVALLIAQNGRSTSARWLWLNFETPLWLLLVVTLAAGVAIGEVAKLMLRWGRSRAADRQRTLSHARGQLRRS